MLLVFTMIAIILFFWIGQSPEACASIEADLAVLEDPYMFALAALIVIAIAVLLAVIDNRGK